MKVANRSRRYAYASVQNLSRRYEYASVQISYTDMSMKVCKSVTELAYHCDRGQVLDVSPALLSRPVSVYSHRINQPQHWHHLVGLVVKASVPRAEDPGPIPGPPRWPSG